MTLARGRAVPLGLAAFAFLLALVQRAGEASSDTKIDLHVDPGGFLADVASMWANSGGLGQVQAGQYAGYLWPMGPFFALGHALGLPEWLVQRLWLGTLLALAAWGTVRLLDELLSRERGVAHVVAGALVLLNPYVVVFSDRTSITLLGYALLPWLLLVVHRGIRDPRSWRWPAAFALLLTSTGGGVNAAVTGWLLLGPLLLLAYEWRLGSVGGRDALRLLGRSALVSVPVCAWWLVPTLIHVSYGINFLPFTESAGAIWTTTSLSESLRMMGYWISYLGIGSFGEQAPYFENSEALLFSEPVVVATLLVPALALGGFAVARRWRYAPFMLALALLALFVMMAGFPEGSPLRRSLIKVYENVEAVQFLRTTYKAGPLLALALACLAGAGAARMWPRLRTLPLRAAAVIGAAALLAANGWPLVTGRAVGEEVTWERIPASWQEAADGLDGELREGTRALVLPGQLFGYYRWGGTVDPILPALTDRPVSLRTITPYSDLHAADLLWAVDEVVTQERGVPGQLGPLLGLLGTGAVISATDDDRVRSGAVNPADAAAALTELGPAEQSYGEARTFQPDRLGPAVALPEVRRNDLPAGDGIVRLAPAAHEWVLDGSAEGIAALATLGPLPQPLFYAADVAPEEIAAAPQVVVTDSNRRRLYVSSSMRQSRGPVLAADEDFPSGAAFLSAFDDAETDEQTVAVYRGARRLHAPTTPGFNQYPEHRPFAAFDGDPSSYWLADHNLAQARHWVEIEFDGPRDIEAIELLPASVGLTDVTEVEVAGRRFDIHPGWNRLELGLRRATSLRVRISAYDRPAGLDPSPALAEVRVPGVHVEEALRVPRVAEQALAASGGKTPSYLFTRVTGDRPFRRGVLGGLPNPAVVRSEGLDAAFLRNPGDPEERLARIVAPPAPAAYGLGGWASSDPAVADSVLDAFAGYAGEASMDSSGRFEGMPGRRASSAFDGDPGTAWIGDWAQGRTPWIEWRGRRETVIERLTLAPPREDVRLPSRVRVRTDGRADVVAVRDGAAELPQQVRTSRVRIEILDTEGPEAGWGIDAVGVAEIGGLPRAAIPRGGSLPGRCDALRVGGGGTQVRLRAQGSRRAFDRGGPVRIESCGELSLPAGESTVEDRGGPLRAYVLSLATGADGGGIPREAAGRVLNPGSGDHGERDDVALRVDAPAWLILGEAHSSGWSAVCDGRDLGEPRVVNGYANAWRVDPGCGAASFSFEPNGWARASYIVAIAALLVLLVILGMTRGRGTPARLPDLREPAAGPMRLRRALLAGALLTPLLAYLFAIRAGLVLGPLVALVLWRGLGAGRLAGMAAAVVGIVLPLVYLLFEPRDRGGFNSDYAHELLGGHWLAVGAYVLLALALFRLLRRPAVR